MMGLKVEDRRADSGAKQNDATRRSLRQNIVGASHRLPQVAVGRRWEFTCQPNSRSSTAKGKLAAHMATAEAVVYTTGASFPFCLFMNSFYLTVINCQLLVPLPGFHR